MRLLAQGGGAAAAPGVSGAGTPGPLALPQGRGYESRDEAGIESGDSRRPPRVDERTERDDRDRRDGRDGRDRRDDDDYPRRSRRDARDDWDERDYRPRPKASPWDKVRLGFLIVFIALCVMGGAHGVGVLAALIGMAAPLGGLAISRIAALPCANA